MKPYYQDSSVTIYHGDCREIVPTLGRFDLLLTDPPYGIKADNRASILSRVKLAAPTDYGESDWDSKPLQISDVQMLLDSAEKAIIWGGNYFPLPPMPGWLVWDKLNGDSDFADCELAWTNLKMAVRKLEFLWNGMLRAGEQRGKRRVHPTQKPVELMTWCLGFAPDANTVLDPYMGSGTTLRAAKDLGRKAVGIEIDEAYCEIAARRMQQEVLALNG